MISEFVFTNKQQSKISLIFELRGFIFYDCPFKNFFLVIFYTRINQKKKGRKIKEQLKLAPKENQPVRKHRTVFTSTKGVFKKQKWVVLDIDEYGITYHSNPGYKGEMFSSMYLVLQEIKIDERSFTLTIKKNDHEVYVIDLKKLDGDLWSNFQIVKEKINSFAGNKLKD